MQNNGDKKQNIANCSLSPFIPVIFQVASLLATLTPGHIVIYAPGDAFTCRRPAA
ncbi:hypothetical protein [Photorhabdus australis]|uniref:hypothetical protein n=1 Tax=Photorhabdus australis TaxID=286156 RepID=UPI000B083979